MVEASGSGHRAETAIRAYIAGRKPAAGRLMNGTFAFRTLSEAEMLSTLLAINYPDPDRVAGGIWELLSNAIEHGNLGIDFSEKSRLLLTGDFDAEIEARLTRHPYCRRVAMATFRRGRSNIRLSVVDQGDGFDFRHFLGGEMPLDAPNGRGIAIASRFCFDKLIYRGRGNWVEAVIAVQQADEDPGPIESVRTDKDPPR